MAAGGTIRLTFVVPPPGAPFSIDVEDGDTIPVEAVATLGMTDQGRDRGEVIARAALEVGGRRLVPCTVVRVERIED